MNDLETTPKSVFGKILAMILAIVPSLRHVLGWVVRAFGSAGDLIREISLSVSNLPNAG
jgi:hypothetical protein